MISFLQKISNFSVGSMRAVQWLCAVAVLVLAKLLLNGIAAEDAGLLSGNVIGFVFLREWIFYIAILLAQLVLLVLLTKEAVARAGAYVLAVLAASFVPYLAGIFVSLPRSVDALRGFPFLYDAQDVGRYILDYFRFAGFSLQLEIIIVILSLVFFVAAKTRSIQKALLSALIFPIIICLHFVFPSVFVWLIGSNIFTSYGDVSYLNPAVAGVYYIFSLFFILITAVRMVVVYYLYDRLKFFSVLHNAIRFPRVLINIGALSLGFGFALSQIPVVQLTLIDYLLILSAYFSILFYWAWAVHDNDLHDQHGDAIAMKQRPLQQGIMTELEIRDLSTIFLIMSLVLAYVVGYGFLLFVLVRIGIGYLYSAEPFRLKRFPIISNITLGVAYLATVLAGYMIISGNTILTFSPGLAALVFLSYLFLSEAKSLSSYEGDVEDGVQTIPTLFGLDRGKQIVGAMGFAAFLLVPVFYFNAFAVLLVPTLVAGAWYYWTVTRKQYEESELQVIVLIFAAYLGILYSLNLI